jgi:hypothetical protein
MNDLRVMRERQLNVAAGLDRLSTVGGSYGSAAICAVTTVVTAYPTVAGRYYAVNPQIITGTEIEGAIPTFTADTNTVIYALNLGTAIPPPGTNMVIHGGSGRWCFRYDG